MAYAQYPGVKHEFAELARAKAGDAQAVVANALEGGAEAIRAGVTRGPGVALAKRASSHLEAAAYRLREDDLLEALEALAAKIRAMPVLAVGVALGIGVAAGVALGRRRPSKRWLR